MASSRAASSRAGRLSWLARVGAIAGAVATTATLPLAAGPALAQPTAPIAPSAPSAGSSAPLGLSITSTSQAYAMPGQTITITGRIKNRTSHVLTGLTVQLLGSTSSFTSESELESFANGQPTNVGQAPVTGVRQVKISNLTKGRSMFWTLRVPVKALSLSCFGVYPFSVQAGDGAGTAQATEPMPLPFWPSNAASCSGARRPKPFTASWVWPLIDSPQQGPCPGLLNNFLASSITDGGRLANLLDVGQTYSKAAHLTWAVDPALLDNLTTMRKPYRVGNSVTCSANGMHPADRQASTWLSSLATATAGQQVFATPYADVDLAGLAQYGDNTDLSNSFSSGQALASRVLHRETKAAPLPAGPKQLSSVAWPADGKASTTLLESLGAMKIGTVILAMPPGATQSYTPGAVTSTPDQVGTQLTVLLADDSLTGLLGSPAAKSRQASQIFKVSQLFEAETAMLVAQLPASQRPVLITPPRRWDPAKDLASALLQDTISAPWLKTATLNQLAAQRREHVVKSVVRPYAKATLTGKLLREVSALGHRVSLLQSIMTRHDPRLNRTLFGIESSRWAGSGITAAQTRLNRLTKYVSNQFEDLSIGGEQKVYRVVLGGKAGPVTVSIHNALGYPVEVGLRVSTNYRTVTATQHNPRELYLVPPQSSTQVKLNVSAAQTGNALVKLTLRSKTGKLLPVQLVKPLTLQLDATNLGTVALVILAAALAIFVIASAAQAIRRGRPNGPGSAAAQPESPAKPDRPDNVDGDRSELSPAGPATANPPGHPTEETR